MLKSISYAFWCAKRSPDFKFEEVSEAFVKCLLRNLKRTKAVGLDDIPGRLLVDSAEVVAKPICTIINLSLKV